MWIQACTVLSCYSLAFLLLGCSLLANFWTQLISGFILRYLTCDTKSKLANVFEWGTFLPISPPHLNGIHRSERPQLRWSRLGHVFSLHRKTRKRTGDLQLSLCRNTANHTNFHIIAFIAYVTHLDSAAVEWTGGN